MKSGVLAVAVLFFAALAHAGDSVNYEVTSSECSDTYKFLNLTDSKTFTVKSETKSAFVEWSHNGLTYHLELTGADAQEYLNPSSIQLSILQLAEDTQGRIASVRGTINQTLVSNNGHSSLTQNYESTYEYPSADEVIQNFVVDGKALEAIRSTRRKMPNGDVEINRTNSNTDESGEFRLVSSNSRCVSKIRSPAELDKLFPALGRKAVHDFSLVIQDDAKRDRAWASLIDAKAMQRAVAESARHSTSRIFVDRDVRASGSRVWENPRLRQMLYGTSPMGRFRFCGVGC